MNTLENIEFTVPEVAIIVYSADSYIVFCDILYRKLVSLGCNARIIEARENSDKPVLSSGQRKKWGVSFVDSDVEFIDKEALLPLIKSSQADYVFLGMPGFEVFKFCKKIDNDMQFNPFLVIATAFPGLLFNNRVSGVFLRTFVDRLLFSDPFLYERSRMAASFFPKLREKYILVGAPRLGEVPVKPGSARQYIVFFEQNVVPPTASARRDLAEKLATITRSHPEKKLLVVSRNRPGEISNHMVKDEERIDFFLKDMGFDNYEVFYDDWLLLLPEIFMALGVSTTALLESSFLGIPSFSVDVDYPQYGKFDARRLFKDIGFVRSGAELTEISVPKAVPGAEKYICAYDPDALLQSIRRRDRPRVGGRSAFIIVRSCFLAGAIMLDWFMTRLRYCSWCK